MTAKTRQMYLLIGLLVALGGVLTYQLSPADTAGGGAAPSNPLQASTPAPEKVANLELERLKPGADTFQAPRRDPFSFRPKPVPPPPPQPARTTTQAPVFVAPQPPAPPPVKPIPLKYIGFVQAPSGVRVAMLTDGSVRPGLLGRQGDVIDGQYRLLRVDVNEIEMSYLDGTGRRRIPKTGQ